MLKNEILTLENEYKYNKAVARKEIQNKLKAFKRQMNAELTNIDVELKNKKEEAFKQYNEKDYTQAELDEILVNLVKRNTCEKSLKDRANKIYKNIIADDFLTYMIVKNVNEDEFEILKTNVEKINSKNLTNEVYPTFTLLYNFESGNFKLFQTFKVSEYLKNENANYEELQENCNVAEKTIKLEIL
jgi:hypothetical protein